MNKIEQYADVQRKIESLVEGEEDVISKMATISCELFHHFDYFDWVGFYRNVGNETLKVGPYQGGHGCLEIPFTRGVCGKCAATLEVQLISDVNEFEGHIACSTSTQSELVLPVFNKEKGLLAVLDIDSDQKNIFDKTDAEQLTMILSQSFSEN